MPTVWKLTCESMSVLKRSPRLKKSRAQLRLEAKIQEKILRWKSRSKMTTKPHRKAMSSYSITWRWKIIDQTDRPCNWLIAHSVRRENRAHFLAITATARCSKGAKTYASVPCLTLWLSELNPIKLCQLAKSWGFPIQRKKLIAQIDSPNKSQKYSSHLNHKNLSLRSARSQK